MSGDETTTFVAGGLKVQPDKDTKTWVDKDLETDGEKSILDQLRSEIKRKVERPSIRIEVPERPSMALRFSPNIKQEQINGWRKRAGDGTKKGMNTTHFSCLVLAATNTAIFLNNEEVVDDDGDPVVLSSETILNMTGAARVADAIRDIFSVDPHIDMTALKILEYAGYGDDVDEEESPTEG